MPYIGKQIGIGNYQVLDALTATTTDTYALTKNSVAVFPQTPANCIVSLNGVIQAPFDSYTISGSNIVFDSALTGSDSIDFITVLGDVLNVGTVSDGTIGLAKLSATGTKDSTTFLRGDNTFASPSGGTNTPAFEAYMNAQQTISNNTETAVEFDTENFDTDSAFDTSTYRFTPQTAGKYFVYTMVNVSGDANSNLEYGWCFIRKNGSKLLESRFDYRSNNGRSASPSVSQVVDLNGSTDYVDVYAAVNDTTGSPVIEGGQRFTVFGAYKLIQ